MRPFVQLLCKSLASGLLLAMFSVGTLAAQQNGVIKVGSVCGSCNDHLLSTAKNIPGVTNARYDAATSQLSVTFDGGTSVLDISLELSMAGYDAGDFKRDPKAKALTCCTSSTRGDEDEALGDLDDEVLDDWENPDNLDDLDRLSTRNDSGITDADLEDEAEDDSDLEGFENITDTEDSEDDL
jgi:hypothetical protein